MTSLAFFELLVALVWLLQIEEWFMYFEKLAKTNRALNIDGVCES